jgi:hypothetical protein
LAEVYQCAEHFLDVAQSPLVWYAIPTNKVLKENSWGICDTILLKDLSESRIECEVNVRDEALRSNLQCPNEIQEGF